MKHSLVRPRKKLPKWWKCCISATSTVIALLIPHSHVSAQNLFSRAANSMRCLISNASSGGATNAIISNMPTIIFTVITFVIFAYALVQAIQIFQAVRSGEEATQYIIPIMSFLAGLVIILVLQAALFDDKSC